jgi:hypothetical protein
MDLHQHLLNILLRLQLLQQSSPVGTSGEEGLPMDDVVRILGEELAQDLKEQGFSLDPVVCWTFGQLLLRTLPLSTLGHAWYKTNHPVEDYSLDLNFQQLKERYARSDEVAKAIEILLKDGWVVVSKDGPYEVFEADGTKYTEEFCKKDEPKRQQASLTEDGDERDGRQNIAHKYGLTLQDLESLEADLEDFSYNPSNWE